MRNALLLTLTLFLLVLLYRRLLFFMGKREKKEIYAQFLGDEFQFDGSVLTIRIDLPIESKYNLRMYGPEQELEAELGYGIAPAGVKEFVLNMAVYKPGKYFMQLDTPNHRATRYFIVDSTLHSVRHMNAE